LGHFVLRDAASQAKQEKSIKMLVLEGAALGLLLFGQAAGTLWIVDWGGRGEEDGSRGGGRGDSVRLVMFPGLKKMVRQEGRRQIRSVVKPVV
jgi:hypothetical protein